MASTAEPPASDQLERIARDTGRAAPYTNDLVDSLPEPVRRYFGHAISPGTPLAAGAHLSMRGKIKLGRWLPFRARQVLVPCHGTVWVARIAGVISGSDRYVAGTGPTGSSRRVVIRSAGIDREPVQGRWCHGGGTNGPRSATPDRPHSAP